MPFQRMFLAGLMITACGMVISSGEAEARGRRCRGNVGWRQGNSVYVNQGWTPANYSLTAAPQSNYAASSTLPQQMPNPAPIDPVPDAAKPAQPSVDPAAAPAPKNSSQSG